MTLLVVYWYKCLLRLQPKIICPPSHISLPETFQVGKNTELIKLILLELLQVDKLSFPYLSGAWGTCQNPGNALSS